MKAKTIKKARILPEIKPSFEAVSFSTLSKGDCFLYDTSLWIVGYAEAVETGGGIAINLEDGKVKAVLGEEAVIPVNILITWSRKEEITNGKN